MDGLGLGDVDEYIGEGNVVQVKALELDSSLDSSDSSDKEYLEGFDEIGEQFEIGVYPECLDNAGEIGEYLGNNDELVQGGLSGLSISVIGSNLACSVNHLSFDSLLKIPWISKSSAE